jgi:hypothetical protein
LKQQKDDTRQNIGRALSVRCVANLKRRENICEVNQKMFQFSLNFGNMETIAIAHCFFYKWQFQRYVKTLAVG